MLGSFSVKGRERRGLPPPAPIVLMSFRWLFLGRLLSSRARLRFTNDTILQQQGIAVQ